VTLDSGVRFTLCTFRVLCGKITTGGTEHNFAGSIHFVFGNGHGQRQWFIQPDMSYVFEMDNFYEVILAYPINSMQEKTTFENA